MRIANQPLTASDWAGMAVTGEVEDYMVYVGDFDFGDAADSGAGANSTSNYHTTLADSGPYHGVSNTLFMGNSAPDTETDSYNSTGAAKADGDDLDINGDDEDGVTLSALDNSPLPTSYQAQVKVTNTGTSPAVLYGWIDWDRNGHFDGDEVTSYTVASGTNNQDVILTWDSFTGITSGTTVARFRLTTDSLTNTQTNLTLEDTRSIGAASDGEVEDHSFYIGDYDFGDAADSYLTSNAAFGAAHGVAYKTTIYLGSNNIDAESDGLVSSDAQGDDSDANDDENSISEPIVTVNATINSYSVDVNLRNARTSGVNATLIAWLDTNQDGQFSSDEVVDLVNYDAGGDVAFTASNIPYNTTGKTVQLTWNSISGLTSGTMALRLRLSTQVLTGNDYAGAAIDGEVEDYIINIAGADFGDAPASYGSAQHLASNNDVRLGALIDIDTGNWGNGIDNNGNATDDDTIGDPTNGIDDEDGIALINDLNVVSNSYSVDVSVTNDNSTDAANLYAWFDYDGSGTFDVDELQTQTLAASSGTSTETITWTYTGASIGKRYIRIRITTDDLTTTETGNTVDPRSIVDSSNGEVEDYQVNILHPGVIDPTTTDTDNDGVTDDIDIDDDNDGILDTVELPNCAADDELSINWDIETERTVSQVLTKITKPDNMVTVGSAYSNPIGGGAWSLSSSTPISSYQDAIDNNAYQQGTFTVGDDPLYVTSGYVYYSLSTSLLVMIADNAAFNNPTVLNDGTTYTQANQYKAATPASYINESTWWRVPASYSGQYRLNPNTTYYVRFYPAVTSSSHDLIGIGVNLNKAGCSDDFDGDNIPNHLDLDSDGDGIPDNLEAQLTNSYLLPNNDSDSTYTSNNGLNSAYIAANYGQQGITPVNTDGDINGDWIDTNADNTETDDTTEGAISGSLTGIDSNFDGIDDGIIPVPAVGEWGPVNYLISDTIDSSAEFIAAFPAANGSEVDWRRSLINDYGDAPDTFATTAASNGANHALSDELFIGAIKADQDNDGQPNITALGDDNNGNDDEDGLATIPVLSPSMTNWSLDVPVTNTTGTDATLYAWVDHDVDGKFQADEMTSVNVPNNTNNSNVTLNWTNLSDGTSGDVGDSYIRLRLTTDDLNSTQADNAATTDVDERSQGDANNGEVEDHAHKVTFHLLIQQSAGAINYRISGGGSYNTIAVFENNYGVGYVTYDTLVPTQNIATDFTLTDYQMVLYQHDNTNNSNNDSTAEIDALMLIAIKVVYYLQRLRAVFLLTQVNELMLIFCKIWLFWRQCHRICGLQWSINAAKVPSINLGRGISRAGYSNNNGYIIDS
ncbi:GEVED domain-containing protein [Shewanella marina]|uniref:GEVED domain-containing protein n=1 Tax=Shewanella marina TaxID=487319 RepID=UPI001F3FC307|nr:GEVED domain-containing protein [Shewanella marina]